MNETDPLYSSSIFTCVVNAFLAYTATMLNILTIHAMRKTSSLPQPLKTLLLSLAVSDLGVGLLAQPLYIARMRNPTYSTIASFTMITNVFVIASFSLVLAISVDRFLAIYLHLRYQELVTHKRVFAAVISIWTLSVLYSPLVFYLKLKKPILAVINPIFVFCFIISGIIYSRIYLTTRHHANQIQVLQIQVAENSQIESAARKRKSAISMFYVYLVFLVCYLPEYCVRVAIAHFIKSPQSLVGVYHYSLTLMFLNSV